MMIEQIRRAGTGHYGISRAEVGWILEDNGPMISIAEAIESERQPDLPDLRKGAVARAKRPAGSLPRAFVLAVLARFSGRCPGGRG